MVIKHDCHSEEEVVDCRIVVLNSANFGSAQSRKRAYIVASLDRVPILPVGNGIRKNFRDIMENLPAEKLLKMDIKPLKHNSHGLIKVGYLPTVNSHLGSRIYSPDGLCPTITAFDRVRPKFLQDGLIHVTTSLEAWRCMGFPDKMYETAKEICPADRTLFGMAGNSIVIEILSEIYQNMFLKQSYQSRLEVKS